MYQAFISYKEIENEKIKVNKYYHTQWLEKENLPCKIEGLNMDSDMKILYVKLQGQN